MLLLEPRMSHLPPYSTMGKKICFPCRLRVKEDTLGLALLVFCGTALYAGGSSSCVWQLKLILVTKLKGFSLTNTISTRMKRRPSVSSLLTSLSCWNVTVFYQLLSLPPVYVPTVSVFTCSLCASWFLTIECKPLIIHPRLLYHSLPSPFYLSP